MRSHACVAPPPVSHAGGGPATTLTAKSSSPGPHHLVAVRSARHARQLQHAAGDDQERPGRRRPTAPGGVAEEVEPAAGERRSSGTGPRPASSATTPAGPSRGAASAVDAGVDDRVDLGAAVERVVAVHHAGDPRAEAVEQDRAGGQLDRRRRARCVVQSGPRRAWWAAIRLAHLVVGRARRWRGRCRRRAAARPARSCRCGGRRGSGRGSCVEVDERVDGGDRDRRAAALAARWSRTAGRSAASAAFASAAPTKPTGSPTISAGLARRVRDQLGQRGRRVADHPDGAGRRLRGGEAHRRRRAGRRHRASARELVERDDRRARRDPRRHHPRVAVDRRAGEQRLAARARAPPRRAPATPRTRGPPTRGSPARPPRARAAAGARDRSASAGSGSSRCSIGWITRAMSPPRTSRAPSCRLLTTSSPARSAARPPRRRSASRRAAPPPPTASGTGTAASSSAA